MSKTLFVGGLSYKTTERDLKEYFAKFGEVDKVEVTRNHSGTSKGYGFVFFTDPLGVDSVLKVSTHKILSRRIDCQRAKAKAQKAEYYKMLRQCRIFVGGLSADITDQDLKEFCRGFGEIKSAYVIKDYNNSKSLGFGYALFKDPKVAKRLVDMKVTSFKGKTINFSAYKTKQAALAAEDGGQGLSGFERHRNQKRLSGSRSSNNANEGGGFKGRRRQNGGGNGRKERNTTYRQRGRAQNQQGARKEKGSEDFYQREKEGRAFRQHKDFEESLQQENSKAQQKSGGGNKKGGASQQKGSNSEKNANKSYSTAAKDTTSRVPRDLATATKKGTKTRSRAKNNNNINQGLHNQRPKEGELLKEDLEPSSQGNSIDEEHVQVIPSSQPSKKGKSKSKKFNNHNIKINIDLVDDSKRKNSRSLVIGKQGENGSLTINRKISQFEDTNYQTSPTVTTKSFQRDRKVSLLEPPSNPYAYGASSAKNCDEGRDQPFKAGATQLEGQGDIMINYGITRRHWSGDGLLRAADIDSGFGDLGQLPETAKSDIAADEKDKNVKLTQEGLRRPQRDAGVGSSLKNSCLNQQKDQTFITKNMLRNSSSDPSQEEKDGYGPKGICKEEESAQNGVNIKSNQNRFTSIMSQKNRKNSAPENGEVVGDARQEPPIINDQKMNFGGDQEGEVEINNNNNNNQIIHNIDGNNNDSKNNEEVRVRFTSKRAVREAIHSLPPNFHGDQLSKQFSLNAGVPFSHPNLKYNFSRKPKSFDFEQTPRQGGFDGVTTQPFFEWGAWNHGSRPAQRAGYGLPMNPLRAYFEGAKAINNSCFGNDWAPFGVLNGRGSARDMRTPSFFGC